MLKLNETIWRDDHFRRLLKVNAATAADHFRRLLEADAVTADIANSLLC